MGTHFCRQALVVAVLAAATTSHADVQAQSPAVTADLTQLAWLVGTWRGESKTPDGKPATNVFTFEWAPGRTAFRYTIERTSGGVTVPALVGLCTWHPAKSAFVLLEVSDRGDVTESLLRAQGERYTYEETIFGADGTVLPVRAEAERDGDDTFIFRARVQQGGDWKIVFATTWRRVRH
jgi:hypothetical protein